MSADAIIITVGFAAIIYFFQRIHTHLKAINFILREDDRMRYVGSQL